MFSVHTWMGGRVWPRLHPGYLSLLLFGFFCGLLPGSEAMIMKDGTYRMCATSPEQSALHETGAIRGGVDTVHPHERLPCEQLKSDQKRFRTADGTCNARDNLGAAFSFVKRLMPPYYQGNNSEPRQWAKSGRRLPNARTVSRSIHKPKPTRSDFTLLTMQIGQLLDHDLSIVPVATEFDSTIKCCSVPKAKKYHDCFEIIIPPGDPIFKECMEFVRSDPLTYENGEVPQPRAHINAITAWMDASMVYGSDRDRMKELRRNNGTGALLKTVFYKGKERLPKGHDENCINLKNSDFCALAGDNRVNEQPGLTAMHTIFHKEHNRLTRKLVKALLYRTGRPYSDYYVEQYLQTAPAKIQERIFQVVRKVVGGLWQHVIYSEYLPIILGPRHMTKYKLWTGHRVAYDPDVDPSIAIEFLTAAFRFGHTLVSDMMVTDKAHALKELFSESSHTLDHFEKIMKGLVSNSNPAEKYDANIVESLVDHLFENNLKGRPGLDLASLNIQRGRDHGLPSFNKLREFFGLTKFYYFRQFTAEEMVNVYEHPDDVDLFTGGTSEEPMEDGIVGELFANIIGQQFHDLKYGDRYYFETDSTYYGFTHVQLHTLKRVHLSKILCENADIEAIQVNPFKFPDYYRNPLYRCSSYPDINMWYFTDLIY